MQKPLIFLLPLLLMIYCSPKIHKYYLTDKTPVDDAAPQKNGSPCNDFMNYAPDAIHPEYTPVRYVRVNFHFMRKSDGTGNFSEKEGRQYVHDLLWVANQRLRENKKMNLPLGNNTPVLPMQYQYRLAGKDSADEGIYFHDNDEDYIFNKKSSKKFSGHLYQKYGVRKGEVLNIFMVEHHPDSIASPTYKASKDGIGSSYWAIVAAAYQDFGDTIGVYNGNPLIEGAWNQVGIFNHELGHSLGLPHTWNTNDGCDDTPKNPNCWGYKDGPPCNEFVSNNMMDYNSTKEALTPCQVAKMHYNFSREGSSQRKLLEPVWCNFDESYNIHIHSEDTITWNARKDLQGHIIVEDNALLIIKCKIALPEGAKIVVKPRGKLILDGGKITNNCGTQWKGIQIWKRKKEKGEVVFKKNAVLENVLHPLTEADHSL